MTTILKLRFVFFLLIGSLSFNLISCSDEEEPTDPEPIENPDPDPDPNPDPNPDPSPLDSAGFMISFTKVLDRFETGNASDIDVTFSAPSSDDVDYVRLFVVKETNVSNVDYSSLSNLLSDQYVDINMENKNNYSTTLVDDMKDFGGDLITEDVTYVVFAISYGPYLDQTAEILSNHSEAVILTQQIGVSTLVPDFAGDDALTLDNEGNIYASEFTAQGTGTRIMKVSPTGDVSVFADGLSGSLGNVFDDQGNFYVTNNYDNQHRKIVKITPDGTQSDFAVIPGYPAGLIINSEGNILVSNYSSSKIYSITPAGDTAVYVDDPKLDGGVGMAYDDNNNLIVGNFKTGDILTIDADLNVSVLASIEVVVNGFVIGYITYLDGHVYATGIRSHKLYKVSMDGNVEVFAGTGSNKTYDAPLLDASFGGCNGIVADQENKILYITQFSKKALRKIQL